MVPGGGAGLLALRARFRHPFVLVLVAALVVVPLTVRVAARAIGDDRCGDFARAAADRRAADTGSGTPVTVIGDSYSVGLGLDEARDAWPARLPGRVHVDGFSGSGFSARASACGRVSYADRAARAVRATGGAGLVVVEGGLNDVDRTDAEIRAGFDRLLGVLDDHRVVVVGPATAPARAGRVPRVDALLAELSAAHGATYLRMSGLDLSYLRDDLHLTAEGHRDFGDAVAEGLAEQQLVEPTER